MAYEYETVVGDDGVTEVTYTKDRLYMGVKGERSHRCHLCAEGFRQSDMKFFDGAWYGVPCGCYRDLPQIIEQRRANRDGSIRQG